MKKILITGMAGFIGFHLAKRLINEGYEVIGLDNLNDYYDVNLKLARLVELGFNPVLNEDNINLSTQNKSGFYKVDLTDDKQLEKIFKEHKFDVVVNLAAQPGIRYSLTNPKSYINSNVVGFLNLLECCRYNDIEHLIYASSSSVYGANKKIPFAVSDRVDNPISLYAATKLSNELMAYTYSHLYGIPVTGLRFFTVYGPFGRPDMAYFKFTKKIINGETIDVYNNGKMKRDFTFIGDIVEGICRLIPHIPGKKADHPAYGLHNIGNNNTIELMRFINIIEEETGRKANINFMPLQPGDVVETYADIDSLYNTLGFKPRTTIEKGLSVFIDWFKSYYNIR